MTIDTRPYHEALAGPPADYTEWETPRLRQHVRDMLLEKEVASQRHSDELERQIGLACFELAVRNDGQGESAPC